MLTLALSACSGGSTAGGQTLVFTGLAGEPDSLNPLVSTSTDLYNLSHLYMSLLVESDARGRLVPEIASAVPTMQNGGISPDGRTIVYHLRRNVRWQDGVALTARDVLFSYRAAIDPRNNVPTRVGYTDVFSVSAPDAYTVVVRMRRPFSPSDR
ncbi:MAG: ABC transporter substrate-binding protein [Candidatus Baltobacteraceae bacterium]